MITKWSVALSNGSKASFDAHLIKLIKSSNAVYDQPECGQRFAVVENVDGENNARPKIESKCHTWRDSSCGNRSENDHERFAKFDNADIQSRLSSQSAAARNSIIVEPKALLTVYSHRWQFLPFDNTRRLSFQSFLNAIPLFELVLIVSFTIYKYWASERLTAALSKLIAFAAVFRRIWITSLRWKTIMVSYFYFYFVVFSFIFFRERNFHKFLSNI